MKDFVAPSATDILIPAFAGQTLEDANAECERWGVVCSVLERDASDRFPRDVVITQQLLAGTQRARGPKDFVRRGTGVQIFPMPDLRFESLRNVATPNSDAWKLTLAGTTTVANDDVPANYVLTEDPVPLTSVREGSSVHLTLSKGPPASVVLPTFVTLAHR